MPLLRTNFKGLGNWVCRTKGWTLDSIYFIFELSIQVKCWTLHHFIIQRIWTKNVQSKYLNIVPVEISPACVGY